MSVELSSSSSPDSDPWQCSLAFYRAFRPAHVVTSPDPTSAAEEDLFIIKLHQRLLPPSDVSQPLDHEFVDEHYSQQLSSEDGLEFLRANWCLLLALLFPYGGMSDASSTMDTIALTEAQKLARNQATLPTPITAQEACSAGALSPSDNAVLRDPGTLDRVYFSFVVFLRFFGWRVHDEQRGVLDRHRGWAARYKLLEGGAGTLTGAAPGNPTAALQRLWDTLDGAAPTYDGDFNFYEVAISHMLTSLLSVGLVLFAIRLVDFLVEEMSASRLLALLPLVEQRWLPLLESHEAVDPSHPKRLRKRLYRLTHSDSD